VDKPDGSILGHVGEQKESTGCSIEQTQVTNTCHSDAERSVGGGTLQKILAAVQSVGMDLLPVITVLVFLRSLAKTARDDVLSRLKKRF
jgi:enamine deaminase RidA (YjgF/YER057c/UK114 family)